jgi:predicted nucleic acid-binding protein
VNGWLLDTNVIASLIAVTGAPSVKVWAERQDEARIYISIISLAEYDKGIHQLPEGDPQRTRYSANRDAIAARFGARILPVSNAVMLRWGAITGRIRRETGHPPPVIDTLLAATALEAGLYLATRNTKDVRHTGAIVFNPWDDDPAKFPLTLGR